ncbi:hypothetical protein L8Q54_15420 [Enterobacter kobei]|uniref:hypothetical protein n=1 Tax=Enterobacter kobei TaxID=208224 RepID=UPI002004B68B|nr:hypothetical protein [Enterobacter kobei]MCK6919656.1 hypothetical protein [Enterobacter kobei]
MEKGYPGNGDYPPTYITVSLTVRDKKSKERRTFPAYWSGFKWVGLGGFKVGNSKKEWWIRG